MTRISTRDGVLFALLVGLAAATRLIPHPPNFTALVAVSLLAGWVFQSRLLAACVPMAAMLLSDAVIGGYSLGIMIAVYAGLLVPLAMRRLLCDGRNPWRIGSAAALSSLAFFVISNGAVWAFGSMYPRDAGGLLACYLAAVPFFKWQLAGDLLYSGALFGLAAVLPRAFEAARRHALAG